MARNRMLNPEFWLDEDLAKLSAHARLLYQGLWGICDDNYATLPNRPEWIKAQVFPYEQLDIRLLLGELSVSGHIILFRFEEQEYWYIKNFFKHQKVERPSKPKYPKYEAEFKVLGEESVNTLSEVKLSKVKLSKDNLQTAVAVADDLNSLIGMFKEVNPSYEKLYSNKTQRKALQDMLSTHGRDKVEWSINYAKRMYGKQFAPQITTPVQLEQKLGSLIAYAKSKEDEKPKIAVMPL